EVIARRKQEDVLRAAAALEQPVGGEENREKKGKLVRVESHVMSRPPRIASPPESPLDDFVGVPASAGPICVAVSAWPAPPDASGPARQHRVNPLFVRRRDVIACSADWRFVTG